MKRAWTSPQVKSALLNWRVIALIAITFLLILHSWPSSPFSHTSVLVNDYIENTLAEMRFNQDGNLASRMLVDLIFGNARH
ncbi:hypothetical protein [Photobacterium rosenbergii]|uniref:Uncharacterized protein n=1 Tax=Photobacterium rosenbergii TaxID=294936 RepID=A0A2T3NFY8_9GAMM|nr:hypothetical protein [Photobacterium rosenbergii]MBY5945976.1 hypothetical protein [Photobacterium rosenbergii]PSW13431.1 hypothetical protein C9J01_11400 [Photobacterium rosenbergii]